MSNFKKRVPKGIKLSKNVYIFCEGKTEEVYFNRLNQLAKKSNISVKAKEVSQSASALVNEAIRARKISPYEVYVVFDKDNNTNQAIEQAISLARRNNIGVAFTNVCFELWLLLHYEKVFVNSLSHSRLYSKINGHINIQDYKNRKGDQAIIHKIAENFIFAVKSNDELMEQNSFWKVNPYSDIHELVKKIFI